MPTAADLPVGSVVANGRVAYVKSQWFQWRGTNGAHYQDDQIDDAILAGATVLRVGAGEDIGEPVPARALEDHVGRQVKTPDGWQTITAANEYGTVWTVERGGRPWRMAATGALHVRNNLTDAGRAVLAAADTPKGR